MNVDAFLERLDSPHIEANGGVELERTPSRGYLWAAEHHADLLAQLVREYADRAGFVECAGELAKSLTHQPRLQARQ